jgi:hypothetical protein
LREPKENLGQSTRTVLVVSAYLCYKDSPLEFMLLKLVEMTPEGFENYAQKLAEDNNINPSTTHLVCLDGKTRDEIEGLMRELGMITEANEREVLADIKNLLLS